MEEHRLNNYIIPGPLRPLGNQVLVKLRRTEDKTTGGLYVPTAEVEAPKEGFVVAAGPGAVHPETGALMECPVKEGELVLLSDFTGERVEYDSQKHMFLDASSILGKFPEKSVTAEGFVPLGDRVLVACAEAAKETVTGIAIAMDEEEDSNEGEVVAKGAGKTLANGDLKAVEIDLGEHVLFNKYTASETTLDGKRFKVVSEKDCIAKW